MKETTENNIMLHIAGKQNAAGISVEDLSAIAKKFPSFGVAQFLLAKKLKSENHPGFEKQAQSAILHFPNSLWFHFKLNETELLKEKALVPAMEQPANGESSIPEIIETRQPEEAVLPVDDNAKSHVIVEAVAEENKEMPEAEVIKQPEAAETPAEPLIEDVAANEVENEEHIVETDEQIIQAAPAEEYHGETHVAELPEESAKAEPATVSETIIQEETQAVNSQEQVEPPAFKQESQVEPYEAITQEATQQQIHNTEEKVELHAVEQESHIEPHEGVRQEATLHKIHDFNTEEQVEPPAVEKESQVEDILTPEAIVTSTAKAPAGPDLSEEIAKEVTDENAQPDIEESYHPLALQHETLSPEVVADEMGEPINNIEPIDPEEITVPADEAAERGEDGQLPEKNKEEVYEDSDNETEPEITPLPTDKIAALLKDQFEEFKKPVEEHVPLPIETEPYHTIDYFASQGIKLNLEQQKQDHLSVKVRKFTDWLKQMKRINPQPADLGVDEVSEHKVQDSAASSNKTTDIVTETMAEVLAKQGMTDKAIQVYIKLSFLDPAKSAYFAAKIEQLKGI